MTGENADNTAAQRRTELSDLRVVVDRIEGRSVCGLRPGDSFDVTCSSRLSIPAGRHFCLYALSAVLPLLPAAQRSVDPDDWLASDEVACPDPEERLIMRIERTGRRSIPTEDLT
ncbi:TIGR04076 family protein [Occultella glacieicola]|uniref:TIGR04076 family protein n=2 Tax=Occultella glacieicola TaxID=2518684 RepID=A0ABY2E9G1_9MICO|nr:TIGR04076 family protein [Occultella glacieicola]